ncbi:hypothetical protein ACP4OV_027942 [Aristida adscensionis]
MAARRRGWRAVRHRAGAEGGVLAAQAVAQPASPVCLPEQRPARQGKPSMTDLWPGHGNVADLSTKVFRTTAERRPQQSER